MRRTKPASAGRIRRLANVHLPVFIFVVGGNDLFRLFSGRCLRTRRPQCFQVLAAIDGHRGSRPSVVSVVLRYQPMGSAYTLLLARQRMACGWCGVVWRNVACAVRTPGDEPISVEVNLVEHVAISLLLFHHWVLRHRGSLRRHLHRGRSAVRERTPTPAVPCRPFQIHATTARRRGLDSSWRIIGG